MNDLRLDHVRKSYNGVTALPDLSFAVKPGELTALLGPSGCGKTTTLRIIAGFEAIDRGHVLIGGQDVTRQPARLREIGVVFQNYALFPHLSVAENVGFGLKMRGKAKPEIASAIKNALDLVQLPGVEQRLPRQLSGGQQQRVALARALAIRPRLLLLDEPLSNLDAKLRDELREEIRRVQQRVGITTIFVTHDQGEALAMADRIIVMRSGVIMQEGTPTEIYQTPSCPFVASFIGRAALLRGQVRAIEGARVHCDTKDGLRFIGHGQGLSVGANIVGVIRTERIQINAATDNVFTAKVVTTTYLGAATRLSCRIGTERIEVIQNAPVTTAPPASGTDIHLGWNVPDCGILLDENTIASNIR